MKYRLGLDMGVASIGWAVVSKDDQFVDSGVRIFPAGVDNFNSAKEKHPNIDRREARSMRRRIRRKAQRKQYIKIVMQELGWMPTDPKALEAWHQQNVYELRHRGLGEKLSLQEFGRVLLHLNQRRGFLSLRKTEETNADKEVQGMLGEISDLSLAVRNSGHETLGSYLYSVYEMEGITVRIRNRHTSRKMLHDEFCKLWEAQAAHHPGVLTKQLRYGDLGPREKPESVTKPIRRVKGRTLLEQFGFENLTFFQRAVYWKAASIGFCELEPEEQRAPISDRRFQRFRMFQEISNLRVLDSSMERGKAERSLSAEERAAIVEYTTTKKEVKFGALKKYLARKLKDETALQYRFNLEAGGRGKLSAMPTDYALASKKAFGKQWWDLDDEIKNAVVAAITSPVATDSDIRDELESINSLKSEDIDTLLKVSLPVGYAGLSVKALVKLLPFMEQGMLYSTADPSQSAIHAAGYIRRDQEINRVYDLLPHYEYNTIPHLAKINNPVVNRSITELRKIVNSLIRKYGKPDRIHLEMARALKIGPKKRKEMEKENRQREADRDSAREELEKYNVVATGDAISLYRLWEEQQKRCAYSGRAIGVNDLLGGQVEIDHIYPYSRSADDSFMNKVVCFRSENREKGNKTPHEWLAESNPTKYDQMNKFAECLPFNKQKRFCTEEIPEGFVARDLNDTAWMTKAARLYLSCLYRTPASVMCTKGMHTSKLRAHWELHGLLRDDGLDVKTRDDHRHHALDAAVIATCDHAVIEQLCKKHVFENGWIDERAGRRRFRHWYSRGDALNPPWESFRVDLAESLNQIWVSHKPSRKVSGRMHKETYYGITTGGNLVVRKPINKLTDKEVSNVRDPIIKSLLEDVLRRGGSLEDEIRLPSGTPVRKARFVVKSASIALRGGKTHVQSDCTHHLSIFRDDDGSYAFKPVILFEAMRRKSSGESVYQDAHPEQPESSALVMHLCPGDTILAGAPDEEQLYVFRTMNTVSKQTFFAQHTDATKGNKHPDTGKGTLFSCREGTFGKNFPNARKVTALPSGELRTN
jgi:CRISPR-associated endonuclease Csn1